MVEVVALLLALVLVPLSGGSFRRLAALEFDAPWLLFSGLAIQILVEFTDVIPDSRADDLGFALLLGSYVLILTFGILNLRITGMAIVTIGIALNTTAIALNQGMPYKVRGDEEPVVSVKHRPERDGDVLTVLDDRIYIPGPLSESVSFGDLILAVGIVDVVYRASRRPRRSSRAGAAHADHPPEAVSTWRRPLPTPARPEGAEEPAPAGEAARASAGEAARASAGEAERASAGEGANASWNVRPAPAEPERAGEPVPEGAEEPVLDLVAAEGFPGLGNAAARDRRWPLRAPWYSHHPTLRRLEPPPAPPDGSESPDGSPSYGAVLRSLRGDADPGVDPGRAFEHALERGEDAGIVDVPRS